MALRALCLFFTLSACGSTQMAAEPRVKSEEDATEPVEAETTKAATSPQERHVSHAELIVPVDAKDPKWGAESAPVTLVQFVDLECPFSARAALTLEALKHQYGPEKLRIVFKSNPLPFHKRAPMAHDAALAVYALSGPDSFERYKGLIFSHRSEISQAKLEEWAEQVGIPALSLKQELLSGRPTAHVVADQEIAAELGLIGTPEFFINGVSLSGAVPADEFVKIIDAELGAATRLRETGAGEMAIYSLRLKKNYRTKSERDEARKARESALDPNQVRFEVPVLPTDPTRGPEEAPVTLVVFSDFQCPFCKRLLPTLERVRTEYGGDVRIVWKDNPLPFHKEADAAAQVARYIHKRRGNDAFWRAHDQLFREQANLGPVLYEKALRSSGLSLTTLSQTDRDQLAHEIAESVQLTVEFEARGTPSSFINGRRLSGAQPFENFKAVIDEELRDIKTVAEQ